MRPSVGTLRCWILLASLLLWPREAAAQASRSAAELEGMVRDATGAAVPGATVEVVEQDTGATRATVTDGTGRWRLPELPVGVYNVRVTLSDFSPSVARSVRLLLGQTVRLETTLQPAGVTAEVTVTAEPTAIDASRTAHTLTVENERILELPSRGRNYLSFVLLAPGVTPAPRRAQGAGPLGDSGFSFAGLRPRSNALTIDGVDNTEEYTGAARTALSLEIVREFQIVNSGLSAEAGGSSGGAINVVTKTGTNVFHGDAFVFARAEPLSARGHNHAAQEEAGASRSRRWRAGLALSGPVRRNRTFFAFAAEQEHARDPEPAPVSPATVSAVDSLLASGLLPALAVRRLASASAGAEETEASVKVNHQISGAHALMLRYSYVNDRRTGDAFGADALTDASARGSAFTRDHGAVGSLVTTWPQAVSDLRVQAAWRRVSLHTGDPPGPGVVVPGLIRFGSPWEGNGVRTETRLQAAETVSLARGPHLLKVGATVNRVRADADTRDGARGLFTFASLEDLAAARPDSFRQAFGQTRTRLPVTSFGAFVHDRLSRGRLTVDAGVRYDFEALPAGIPEDVDDLSPRLGVGFALDPRTMLRASVGRYHDRYVLAALERPLREDGRRAFEQVIDAPEAARVLRATGGGALEERWSGVPPSRFAVAPSLPAPSSDQASVSLERLVAHDLTATVSYLFTRGRDQQRTRNVNLQRAGGGFTPIDPAWSDVFRLEATARSTYHGVSLVLNHRFAQDMAWTVAYTVSRARDDASDFDEQPNDPTDLRAERSWSRYHQAHRLSLNGLFDFFEAEEARPGEVGRRGRPPLLRQLFGQWELAPVVTVGSGRPVNPLLGVDANRTHAHPPAARPEGLARNSLRTPGTVNVDARLTKYVAVGRRGKLDLVVDVFNLLNRTNVIAVDSYLPRVAARDRSRPILFAPRREVQLSIDFEF